MHHWIVSVYAQKAPQGLNTIGTEALTLTDVINIGICNNPTLAQGFMAVKMQEAELGSACGHIFPISRGASIDAGYQKTENNASSNPTLMVRTLP